MHLGLISRKEALADGTSPAALYRKVHGGKWQELFPGIYLPSPQPPSFEQELLGACCWADGVASHRSGATAYRMLDLPLIELTTKRNVRSPRPGVVVHKVASLKESDVTRIGVIPVTTPVRTLIDLAAVVDATALRDAVDNARRRDLISWQRLAKALDQPWRGRTGVAELRQILKEGMDSQLERMLKRVIYKSDLPRAVSQHGVRTPRGQRFFIDFAYPQHLIAIESDGFGSHSDRNAFLHDRVKWRELANLGWTVLCFTYEEIKSSPQEVIRAIATALAHKSVLSTQSRAFP